LILRGGFELGGESFDDLRNGFFFSIRFGDRSCRFEGRGWWRLRPGQRQDDRGGVGRDGSVTRSCGNDAVLFEGGFFGPCPAIGCAGEMIGCAGEMIGCAEETAGCAGDTVPRAGKSVSEKAT
jgi:hypothetical protein